LAFVLVLVLVLVLEDVVFSEVAELRESAGSELHPRSGLGMLKGRKMFILAKRQTPNTERLVRAARISCQHLGLKPPG
jgi:3-polyprenyl-4-hydroxybenzoate decarboxylase